MANRDKTGTLDEQWGGRSNGSTTIVNRYVDPRYRNLRIMDENHKLVNVPSATGTLTGTTRVPDMPPLPDNGVEPPAHVKASKENFGKLSVAQRQEISHHIPGYQGFVKNIQFYQGDTYGRTTEMCLGDNSNTGRP